MSASFPALDLIQNQSAWQSYTEFSGSSAFAPHCEALARPGLFTDQLAVLQQGQVRVEVGRQGAMNELEDTSRRDVQIFTGTTLVAVASTILSEQVLVAESWLRSLGNRPIGEMLEQRLGAVRTDCMYHAVASGSALFANFPEEQALWGRRYLYTFATGSLTITEIISDRVLSNLFSCQSLIPERQ